VKMSIRLTPADCQMAVCVEHEKLADDFFDRYFPSITAGARAYSASRDVQRALEAEREAQLYPALHATQPDMWYAQQQAMFGGGLSSTPSPPVHHRHRRHRHLG
jgi:hypothetical protein